MESLATADSASLEIGQLGHLVNGVVIRQGETFPVLSPKSGELVGDCPSASADLLDEAMEAATRAQQQWAARTQEDRRNVLEAMSKTLAEHCDQLLQISAAEKGAVVASMELYAAPGFAAHLASTDLPVDIVEDTDERVVSVVRKPVGVVAAITPWNAPILIATEKIFSALVAGNSVVVKPSPFTPFGTLALGEIWKDIVPPGVLTILVGGDELGERLVNHPLTSMISFTGSIAAGRQIASAAGQDLKRVLLELGGNDAAIVLPDVDVKAVAQRVFSAAFLMGGQVCAAVKRLYVHESIFDEMVSELAQLADAAKPLPEEEGGTLVPITTGPQYERVCELANDAIAHGAIAVSGGKAVNGSGFFFPATILTNVGPGVRVVDEEQFGPLLPVMSFSDIDDAVRLANSTEFGLCGSVWTSDLARGAAIADRLECGTTWVNHHADIAPYIPFGGMKHSGIGRSNGAPGLDAYCELQTQFLYKSPDRVGPG
jgi:acyl-CoA reductase-like NAD-dependent aldehyde dehydrogenase